MHAILVVEYNFAVGEAYPLDRFLSIAGVVCIMSLLATDDQHEHTVYINVRPSIMSSIGYSYWHQMICTTQQNILTYAPRDTILHIYIDQNDWLMCAVFVDYDDQAGRRIAINKCGVTTSSDSKRSTGRVVGLLSRSDQRKGIN
jgi:hypothetical protein